MKPSLHSRTVRGVAAIPAALLCAALGAPLASASTDPDELRRRAAASQLGSLSGTKVPEPPNLRRFVRDDETLKLLGKALFWDQQVGSDGQACASCHFHAGADNRSKNQLNPGFRNETAAFPGGDFAFGNSPLSPQSLPVHFGPNTQLVADDFPLHKLEDPSDRGSRLLSDTNDVVSSQGVFNALFHAGGLPNDVGQIQDLGGFGAIFNVDGVLVRNVEPRNTPTTINAVFNARNFWDGRARREFNGVNPIGKLDPTARVVWVSKREPLFLPVNIPFASLGSQADGPPESDLEMAFAGRRFAEAGKKLLGPHTIPLAEQLVDPADSLLGAYARQRAAPGVRGATFRYHELVQKAFREEWWKAPGWVVDVNGPEPKLVKASVPGSGQYTVMEWNITLFFGTSVGAYEATLVSDDTPFDRFMEGDDEALGPRQRAGLDVFLGKGKCVNCHGGPEFTNASVANVVNQPIERMIMGNGRTAVYDNGFYNIGVRPTREDLGLGAFIGPKHLPLSDARRWQDCVREKVGKGSSLEAANDACGVPRLRADPEEALELLRRAAERLGSVAGVAALLDDAAAALDAHRPGDAFAALVAAHALLVTADASSAAAALLSDAAGLLPDPLDPGPNPDRPYAPRLSPGERIAADGAFKTPGLRNVELSAPYFHNGGQATLEQVVEFYDRGSDFREQNLDDLDPDIVRLGLTDEEEDDLVAFMKALTDERVRHDRAPFDHPSLDIPNGGTPGVLSYEFFFPIGVLDDRVVLPAVGRDGYAEPLGTPSTPLANFLDPLN